MENYSNELIINHLSVRILNVAHSFYGDRDELRRTTFNKFFDDVSFFPTYYAKEASIKNKLFRYGGFGKKSYFELLDYYEKCDFEIKELRTKPKDMETQVLNFEQLPKAVAMLLEEVKQLKNLITTQTATAEPSQPQDELMNVEQTAEFLNLSVPTIYGKVHRRELPVMKQGNRLYFSKFELLDYLKQGRQ